MSPLLPLVETLRDDVRVVGTASSLLRGIDLAVGDVDILGRRRAIVDELSEGVAAAGGRCLSGPAGLENPEFAQYFSAFELSGVRVELSTVESTRGNTLPFGECAGDAPWENFDVALVEGFEVPLVASELRLLTEVARFRPANWKPIGAHLARHGYDNELFTRALLTLPAELQQVMRDAVTRGSD